MLQATAAVNSVQVPSSYKGKTAVPAFALGATIYGPTYGMIGEGGYPETIVPHTNTPRSRSLLMEAAGGVGMSVGGGDIHITYAPTIVVSGNTSDGVAAEADRGARLAFEELVAELPRRIMEEEGRKRYGTVPGLALG